MDDFGEDDPLFPHDDDKNGDDDDGESTGFENPFTPSGSFPPDDGDEIEMTSTSHRRGAKSSTAETSFIDNMPITEISRERQESVWKSLTAKFPKASAIDLIADYSKTGRLEVSKGALKKIYYLFTTNKKTGEEQLNPQLPKEIKTSLGPTTEQIQDENEKEMTRREKKEEELKNQRELAEENQRDNIDRNIEEEEEQIRNLENVNEQLQERMSLRDRVKAIFKKYGFTTFAVLSAVSVVLGVVLSNLKSGLSKLGKGVGDGFKAIGKKLGEILPGLIGTIASFIFKTAGEVISFLGKNALLLVVAVVL